MPPIKIPTFDELLKKVQQPKVTVKDLVTEEYDKDGAAMAGFDIPLGWKLRRDPTSDSLVSPRGHIFNNFKLKPDGTIADYQVTDLGGKPLRFPKPGAVPDYSQEFGGVRGGIVAPFLKVTPPPIDDINKAIKHMKFTSATHKSDSAWDKEWRSTYADIIDRLNEVSGGEVNDRRVNSAISALFWDIRADKEMASKVLAGRHLSEVSAKEQASVGTYQYAVAGYQQIINLLLPLVSPETREGLEKLFRKEFKDIYAGAVPDYSQEFGGVRTQMPPQVVGGETEPVKYQYVSPDGRTKIPEDSEALTPEIQATWTREVAPAPFRKREGDEIPLSRIPFAKQIDPLGEVAPFKQIHDVMTGPKAEEIKQVLSFIGFVGSLAGIGWQGASAIRSMTEWRRLPQYKAMVEYAKANNISKGSKVFKDAQTSLRSAVNLARGGAKEAADEIMAQFTTSYGKVMSGLQAEANAAQAQIARFAPAFVPGGTQTGAMAFGGIGKPAQVIKVLPSPQDTQILNAAQVLGKKIGLDVEAIGGISAGEYWVSISTPALKGNDAFFKWTTENRSPEEAGKLQSLLEGKFPFKENIRAFGQKRFLPFKNISDASKFLQTGDTSLIAKTITQRGEAWTPEKLAATREAAQQDIARRTKGLEPIREQINQLQAQVNELEPAIKAEEDIEKWKALREQRDAIQDEIYKLKAQYSQATLKAQPGMTPEQAPAAKIKDVTPEVTKEPWQMTKEEAIQSTTAKLVSEAEPGHFPKFDISDWTPSEIEEAGKLTDSFVYTEKGKTYIDFNTGYKRTSEVQRLLAEISPFDEIGHKLSVQQALSEGKPVPAEVLADYPDLKAPEVAPEAVPTAEVTTEGIEIDEPLYHVTPNKNVEAILSNGLDSNLRTRNDFGELRGEDIDMPFEQELIYFTKVKPTSVKKGYTVLVIDESRLPGNIDIAEDVLLSGEFYATSDTAFTIMPEVMGKASKQAVPAAEIPKAEVGMTPKEAEWITKTKINEKGFIQENFYPTEKQAQKAADSLKRKYDFYDTRVFKEREGTFRVQYRKTAETLVPAAEAPAEVAPEATKFHKELIDWFGVAKEGDNVLGILPDGTALKAVGLGAFQHRGVGTVEKWLDAGVVRIVPEENNVISIETRGVVSPQQVKTLRTVMEGKEFINADITDSAGKTIKSFEGTPDEIGDALIESLPSTAEAPAEVAPVEAEAKPKAVAKTIEAEVERVKAKPTIPPVEKSPPPPTAPPSPGGISEEPIPEGRPRTLTDLNREAKGMRALSPEERADVMDMAKPIAEGELLYKIKPFSEHGDNLLQPDKPINKVLRSIPGIKQATEILYPAQMERDNPVALIGIKKRIFEEIETGRARLASLKWWYNAKKEFNFKKVGGKWRATNIELSPTAEPTKSYHATIHDLIEHPKNYKFTPAQEKVLAVAQDMQNQILRDAQRAGVDAVELSGEYWHRIVTKSPKNALFDGKTKGRIASKKGYTRQRAFDFVDEGAVLGFEYETHPLRSLQNRLEAGIRTISDQGARQEIAKLPGVVKTLERLESKYPQTIEGVKTARTARDIAKQTFLRDKSIENEILLRQSEANYIMSMRELYFKKIAAGQPNIGEIKLPNGRIAPIELAEEIGKWIELPEIRTARGSITNPILAITQLLRSTLTNVDLAAGFIQGQALFYRNNVAWWRSQAQAILSIADDRMAYVEKNLEVMDEGMRMGAISVPTEFMFTSQGIASIPTRVPVVGPVMKAFNRAFEWFIVVGQTELYKVARSGVIRRASGKNVAQGEKLESQAIEALTSLGSAIRKEMGTESYSILGIRPTQHTIEQLTFFAARFFRALVGIQFQAFTGGEGGREARRAMGSLIIGGLALLIAASWATERKLPNMTDPFANDWMQFKIGGTRFSTFGPFFPYFRTIARVSVRLAQGEPAEAAKIITWFLQSKEGLLFRGIDMAVQFSTYGSYRTFEGKRIPYTPLGVAEAVLGEMAVPISIQEAMTAIPEGRYESVVAEIVGLVGRKVREGADIEAISMLGKVDQEALDRALKDVTNPKKIAEIKAKDWTYDIQSAVRDIRAGTKYKLDQDIAKMKPIVGEYWEFADQKDEYEGLSTEEKEKYVKDNNDFLVRRLLFGDEGFLTIPDMKTAEAVEAKAKKYNIPLDMIPAFQLTEKGFERIPSDRKLWPTYFEYYSVPGSGGYLSYSQEQVDAGKLPPELLPMWERLQTLKTDKAKAAFRKLHRAATVDMRKELRRSNTAFDAWLVENEYNQELDPISLPRRATTSIRGISLSGGGGGGSRGSLAGRRVARAYPKFKKPSISLGMSIRAPGAPRV